MKNTLTVVALLLSITGIFVSLAREELRCRLGLAEACTSVPSQPIFPGPSLEPSRKPELGELKPEPSPPSSEATTPSEIPSPLSSPESTPTPVVEPLPSPSPIEALPAPESPTPAPETAIPIPVLPPSPDS
ncbi:hypothetical protein [Synechocystis sp. LKSZ1]|uniref:hypothetical protein n=1 Tax=Synechocystis sp. LKSZ1 TaxID=3144951 RepID=UPI00336BFB77